MRRQASDWVGAQKTGGPSGKSLLYALASYAGIYGECSVSMQRLAADSEQSIDSVSRRLKELEARGLIYRIAGARQGGEFAPGVIVLLMDGLSISFAEKHGFRAKVEIAQKQWVAPVIVPQIAARCLAASNEINGLAKQRQVHHAADCGAEAGANGTADCGSVGGAL